MSLALPGPAPPRAQAAARKRLSAPRHAPRVRHAPALALGLAALLLAGCTSPALDEPARPRATPTPGPGILPAAWMAEQLPAEPTPFSVLENRTIALKSSPRATVTVEGHSGEGRPLLGVFLAEGEPGGKPTVSFTGSQHGNEPSGSDAALLLATYLAWGDDAAKALLEAVNVYVLVCANPDGRERDQRGNAGDVDVNRDHMNLATPEARVLHAAFDRVDPVVTVDLHQFGSPPLDVPPTPVSSEVIFEVASVQNPLAYPGIVAASHDLEGAVVQAVSAAFGPGSASSYPPTQSSQDSSIHRNHYGMHNALSLLFEARRPLPEYATEVQLHLVGAEAVLAAVQADPQGPLAAQAEAEHEALPAALPVRGYAAPPQPGVEALVALMHRHGLNATFADAVVARPGVHYEAGPDLLRTEFPAGTLLVSLAQPDWRSASEMFESSAAKDASYTQGPHDLGLDVWRWL